MPLTLKVENTENLFLLLVFRNQVLHSFLGVTDVRFVLCDQRDRLTKSPNSYDEQQLRHDRGTYKTVMSSRHEFSDMYDEQ